MARALGLRAEQLAQVADGWVPEALPSSIRHVETILGSVGSYEVKGYIVHDRGEAVIVDTAYNADAMLEMLAARKLRLRAICLTHGHSDHADGIDVILRASPVPVYLGSDDLDLLSWRPSQEALHEPSPSKQKHSDVPMEDWYLEGLEVLENSKRVAELKKRMTQRATQQWGFYFELLMIAVWIVLGLWRARLEAESVWSFIVYRLILLSFIIRIIERIENASYRPRRGCHGAQPVAEQGAP